MYSAFNEPIMLRFCSFRSCWHVQFAYREELLKVLSFIVTIVLQLANDFITPFGFCSRRVSAGASASGEYTYDTSLVTLHSYLGGRQLFANIPFQFFLHLST